MQQHNRDRQSSAPASVAAGDSTEVAACERASQEAASSCTTDHNSEYKDLISMADTMGRSMQNVSNSSMALACSKIADISQVSNAFLATFKIYCASSVSSCQSACATAEHALRANSAYSASTALRDRLAEAKKNCSSASQRLSGVDSQIAGIAATYSHSSQCKSMTAGSMALPTLADCRANPAIQGCGSVLGVDCALPQVASTNLVCICQRNPNDARCSAGKGSSSFSSLGGDGTAGAPFGGRGGPSADLGSAVGLGGGYDADEFHKGSQHGSPDLGGGGGSPSGGFGKTANSPGGKRATEKSRSRYDANVNSGFRGGSGGGGFSSSSGGGGSRGRLLAQAAAGEKVDYRKFLPQSKEDYQRYVASGTGVGPDGITGPYTDNFVKIKNHYGVIRRSLLPP